MASPNPALLVALIERLQEYRDVLVSKSDLPVDVNQAAEAARAAGLAFQDDLGEATGWYISLFERPDDDEDDDHTPEALPEGQRVSVVTREDFVVTDEAALIDAGRAAYARAWPEDSPEAAEQHVGNGIDAIYQLLHADGLDALSHGAAVPGVRNAGGQSTVEPIEAALQDDPDW